jgi:hypothetical protein
MSMKKKRTGARNGTNKGAVITELEVSFRDERKLYEKVLQATALLSLHQHRMETDGRGLRAVRIFTRQTVLGLSLLHILPRPSGTNQPEEGLWDICSIASLSRNLMEGYLSLHYFGIEGVSEEEAELRFFIAQFHRNIEWYEIRRLSSAADPALKEFEEGIALQRQRIRNHPYLPLLTETQRKRALQGVEMYKTKMGFERQLEVCGDLRRNYRLLSNLVHPLPLSIERIDNDRGRGIVSDADVEYCRICLMLARRYLAASTLGIADHFPNELARWFEEQLEAIRPLVKEGFNEIRA